ncbi:MAG: DUF3108 domain-containing protein, partial [Alphaproteobacteria bacterium]|nr:DUF3108 domain-containing protein [Alphaproteobacteria bacterium]
MLLVFACSGEPACASEPDAVYLRYEVSGGPGLRFITAQVTLSLSGTGYSLVVNAETRGLADFFAGMRSRLEARGRISGDTLYPEEMRTETHQVGTDFYARTHYWPDGMVSAEASPPPGSSVTPVTPAQMRGTIDQLSAYLALARHLAIRGSCALVLAVFDGRRRYDLSFTDLPPESVSGFT